MTSAPACAGKTTTLRLLLGLLDLDEGSAIVLGYDVATRAAAIREHTGVLLEHLACGNGATRALPPSALLWIERTIAGTNLLLRAWSPPRSCWRSTSPCSPWALRAFDARV